MTIPRIFHRIWLGPKPLPAEFAAFGETWAALHPGWEMRLWTDANLPPLANQALFDSAPSFAAKADILRYELLLRFGGVYVDTDFECLKSIEPLLDDVECFVAQQKDLDADFGKFCYVNNALMGAAPGHPLFRDLVESLPQHMASLPPDVPASYLTGPHYLTTVLQSHPEAKIFPAKFFYPYTATERWRRHEKFPDAYAVHHWTLSDVAVNRLKPRQLGSQGVPCLSVCLRPVQHDDGTRLHWVLEGLCLQTVTDFEVLVPAEASPALAALLANFSGRLEIRRLGAMVQPDGAGVFKAGLDAARASRVLFLETDCLPDIDVVETHARSGAKSELLFAYRRIYPAEKFFPFREAVDYGGLVQHCRAERTGLYLVPSPERWQDVEPSCFSVPVALATRAGDIRNGSREAIRAWAGHLAQNGCPSAPCIYSARVTHLIGASDAGLDASGQVANAALVPFRLNDKVASVRLLSTAAGRGADGRSPYVLRCATLNGVRTHEISSLQFHLLEAFQQPKPLEETIGGLIERVAVEIEKRPRVLALCRSYVENFVMEGVLVPVRGRLG
ncbi:MAG: hypothetical protein C0502_10955 [Opitutus sp.]|nr:hypothetical protein [Opitutus sp.]